MDTLKSNLKPITGFLVYLFFIGLSIMNNKIFLNELLISGLLLGGLFIIKTIQNGNEFNNND
ncbi:hypothetical protein [Winogradskyella poriferorum]|uniref:hypothetical protein n=1 Tax=Winogradskyella poriferorum TaxID=307627 RepID=UPI003D6539F6